MKFVLQRARTTAPVIALMALALTPAAALAQGIVSDKGTSSTTWAIPSRTRC